MKFNITLLTIITLSACLHADNEPQPSRFERARARLQAARGKTAQEVAHSEPKETPTLQDVVKSATLDDEEAFNRKLRAHLDNNPGCKTWSESCESSCPTWDKEIDFDTDVSGIPGFDQPIRCKNYLGSCYKSLRGCSQDNLDEQLKDTTDKLCFRSSRGQARCKTIALICQGANPNIPCTDDWTALHVAAWRNDYHFADFLLKHRADVNAKADGLYTPLMALAHQCKYHASSVTDTATLLINTGAETHHRVQIDGGYHYASKTALEIARSQQEHAPCRALADFLETYEQQPNRIQE